ncbi:MAG TPA: YcdB/YcdC domain-containing protein [Syntrophomonadaceae bacterium]|nr:YcdB/YcdC domain-containing protein [Syntrophomonadaceae bacterium]
MYRKKTRFTALLLALLLFAALPAAPVSAASPSVSLEKAIQIVKQNFSIPAEYSKLTSGFNSNAVSQCWSLNWSDPKNNGGSFSAQVDANNGEIVSMNCWKPNNEQTVKVPVLSVDSARQEGSDLLKRLLPSRYASLQLIPDNQLIPLNNYGVLNYSVRWQRLANGIPVQDDGASMQIDMATGQILSYNLNWSNLPLPEAKNIVSAETARQSFINNKMLQMQYMLPSNITPLKGSRQEQQPLLVYGIMHPSNGVIDARSGAPLLLDNRHWLNNAMGAGARDELYDKKMSLPVPLTPEETKEIRQVANLLTQEQAAAAAGKYLQIPADMTLQSSNLDEDWQNPDIRIWNLNWAAPAASTSQSTLYARVNALNGELYSFYLNKPTSPESDSNMSESEARSIAENFLKKVHPQRFQQVTLNNLNNSSAKDGNTWRLNYQRVVNNIPCPFNGMDVNIDMASKEVTSFNLNWSEKTFPTAVNTMNIEKANEVFLAGAPLTLTYVSEYSPDNGPQEMRLVYQPQIPAGQPQSNLIDARTGAWLDSTGNPAEDEAKANSFKDISGHFGEKEIRLLAQAGLFNEYGQEFRPDEKITLISMLRAMLSIKESIYASRNLTDEQVLERAAELHWLTDAKTDPAMTVNRDLLARLLVRYLDIEYLTKFPSMFQLPFNDAQSLPAGLQPYVGLVRSTGLIIGDGVNFDANHQVTRAEAAVSLVRVLKLK